jgi:hypothetical protein
MPFIGRSMVMLLMMPMTLVNAADALAFAARQAWRRQDPHQRSAGGSHAKHKTQTIAFSLNKSR